MKEDEGPVDKVKGAFLEQDGFGEGFRFKLPKG